MGLEDINATGLNPEDEARIIADESVMVVVGVEGGYRPPPATMRYDKRILFLHMHAYGAQDLMFQGVFPPMTTVLGMTMEGGAAIIAQLLLASEGAGYRDQLDDTVAALVDAGHAAIKRKNCPNHGPDDICPECTS